MLHSLRSLFLVSIKSEAMPTSDNDRCVLKIPAYDERAFILLIFFKNGDQCLFNTFIETMKPTMDNQLDISTGLSQDVTEKYITEINQEDRIQQILGDLERLLQDDSVSLMSEAVNAAFDEVDSLLGEENEVDIPGQLLRVLEDLGGRIDLQGEHTGATTRDNIALFLADSTPENPVRGLRLIAKNDNMFFEKSYQFLTDEAVTPSVDDTEAMLFLPESVTCIPRRISFVVFNNDKAFRQAQNCTVNSKILSVRVENFTAFGNGEAVNIKVNPTNKILQRDERRACAYWHFDGNGTGRWSQDGCFIIRSNQKEALDSCICDHLTHFAQIIIQVEVFSEFHELSLEIISMIGCSLSLFGIIVIALTAVTFKAWRTNSSNKVWLHLCAAVFILDVCFIVVVLVDFYENSIACLLVGMILHYAVLSTFGWMLVISVLSYRKLVLVFISDIPRKLLIASVFAWGMPFVIIGILILVIPDSYSIIFEGRSPTGGFCYPKGIGLLMSLICPIFVMWCINWTFYILTIKSRFIDKKIRRHGGSKENLRNASVTFLLAFLCGMPWILGLFAYDIVAAYLFSLMATFQGFIFFVFFVLGNRKTRLHWINLCREKFTRNVTDRQLRILNSPDRRTIAHVDSHFHVPKPTTAVVDESDSELLTERRVWVRIPPA